MRSFDEIGGRFKNLSDKANEAYAVYASAYLDCADDNIQHFLRRGIDTRPIDDVDLENADDVDFLITKSFIDAAIDIVNAAGFESFEEVVARYPLLVKYKDNIVLRKNCMSVN